MCDEQEGAAREWDFGAEGTCTGDIAVFDRVVYILERPRRGRRDTALHAEDVPGGDTALCGVCEG